VLYYPQIGAGHSIKLIFPAFTQAWRAMLNGTRPSDGPALPGALPPGSELPPKPN
jgi:hypothetical protein